MKVCEKCGKENKKGKFCVFCGEKLINKKHNKKIIILVIVISLILISCLVYSFIKLNTKNKEISSLNKKISGLEETNKYYITQMEEYKTQASEFEEQVYFMNKYVAICPINGENLYHCYECSNLKKYSSFYIYNTEKAENLGYKACSCVEKTTKSFFEAYYKKMQDENR